MKEQWITVGSYADIRHANDDAELLKSYSIPCQTIFNEPDSVLFVEPLRDDWIFLKILEEDYEIAADLLDIPLYTVDDAQREMEDTYEKPEMDRSLEVLLWGGFAAAILVIKLIVDGL